MGFLRKFLLATLAFASFFMAAEPVIAQEPSIRDKQKVRTVTVPISIYTKKELRSDQSEEFIKADRLIVREDKEEQTILSIRSVTGAPLEIAVLIQEDLTSNFNLHIKDIADFIRGLPKGTRVMVGYIRGGNLQTAQKFTDDLERAARSLRIVSGIGYGGNGPYGGVHDAIKRFEALPSGRRAVLLVSDGVDTSQGTSPGDITQTIDLERSIARAQKFGVAVYSFYSPTALTNDRNPQLSLGGQGSLQRIADETGGRAFFQGNIAPISLIPFFKDLEILLGRQFALTYLSTHMKKGYHKVEVSSTNPEIKIDHPKGYYYR
ncbi:MAG: hypothetical protein KA956_11325 [Pyrinomonadaceae bacterium]|nr:hypothetical protein [Acidobacteriota bacterium]MBP7377055.1 hypothetical protein [Pyrinomonadaceae bacterium]